MRTVNFPEAAKDLKAELDALAPDVRRAIGMYLVAHSTESDEAILVPSEEVSQRIRKSDAS